MGVGAGREVQTTGRAPEQAVREVCQMMALGKEGEPLSCEHSVEGSARKGRLAAVGAPRKTRTQTLPKAFSLSF